MRNNTGNYWRCQMAKIERVEMGDAREANGSGFYLSPDFYRGAGGQGQQRVNRNSRVFLAARLIVMAAIFGFFVTISQQTTDLAHALLRARDKAEAAWAGHIEQRQHFVASLPQCDVMEMYGLIWQVPLNSHLRSRECVLHLARHAGISSDDVSAMNKSVLAAQNSVEIPRLLSMILFQKGV